MDAVQARVIGNLLVAGSIGSGRSNFLDLYIINLAKKYSPQELEMILVDPKKVQLNQYKKLPHVTLTANGANQLKETLTWLLKESDRRKKKMDQSPQIVMIMEEAADFLVADKEGFEDGIRCIIKDSSQTGVYVVLYTVRGDILSQSLINCFNTRVAFRVNNEVSQRILGTQEAVALSQPGSCYVRDVVTGSCERTQMPFVSDEEIEEFLKTF